ncbi:MAG: Hsp20/alpha crystallin family protein [Micromonosporaceae bacterium]|jgi:HSP20 family protein|nr:Hsp20/alpha crystallin family protein [Micromonosporaceae bacterium]
MSTITRFRGGALAPFDWSSLSWFPLFAPAIRVEDYLEGDRYVVRAELPGIDPAKDVTISYSGGALKLEVERAESRKDRMHSEFHYGSFTRVLSLPSGAKEDTIAATYKDGILEITVQVAEPAPAVKTIPVAVGNGTKG